jgi:hypothetical protein
MRGYNSSVNAGNAGEHLVMAHLLFNGFQAFMADRGNPAFDISVVYGTQHSLLRVKITRTDSLIWTRKKTGQTFLDMRARGDFCCIVDLRDKDLAKAKFYIIPTTVVQSALDAGRKYWTSSPKKDGSPRVDTPGQRVWLTGPTNRHVYEGYEEKWVKYRDAWNQLKSADCQSHFNHVSGVV